MGHRRPGYCPAGTGRVDEAAEYFTRADAAGDQVGADAGSILRTYGQAIMASDRGQYAAALALFVQAHDGFQRLEVAVPTGLALAGSLPPTNISVTPGRPGRLPAAVAARRILRRDGAHGVRSGGSGPRRPGRPRTGTCSRVAGPGRRGPRHLRSPVPRMRHRADQRMRRPLVAVPPGPCVRQITRVRVRSTLVLLDTNRKS